MFGILYSLIAGVYYLGSYVKGEVEDIVEKSEQASKGRHTYVDSQGRSRLISNNRQVLEYRRLDDGRLVDLDAKTHKVVYVHSERRETQEEREYKSMLKWVEEHNEASKKYAIYKGNKTYMGFLPYEFGDLMERNKIVEFDIETGEIIRTFE